MSAELFRAAEGVCLQGRRSRWSTRRCGARPRPAAPSGRACGPAMSPASARRRFRRSRRRNNAGLPIPAAVLHAEGGMSTFIAALPMYDWPETRAATDAEWARFCALLPARRHRRAARPSSGAMPTCRRCPAASATRDGKVIAPDPATLPPDELDFQTLWRHPNLLLCPDLLGADGARAGRACAGGRPAELRRLRGRAGAALFERDLDAGGARRACCAACRRQRRSSRSTCIRGKRFAYNSLDSMSGIIAPTRDLEALGESLDIFSERIETGAHRASIVAVAEGRADVCAIDCRSWHMAKRHEPQAGGGARSSAGPACARACR